MVAAGYKAFSEEMRKLGWNEGQNLIILHRYHNQPNVDLPRLVADLIASNINVLTVSGPEAVVRTVALARADEVIE